MTLLITVIAAVVSTVFWYKDAPGGKMNIKMLCFMFWGASLMWFVDAIFEYAELGAKYFTPAPLDMLNDFYLGLCVIALALVVWVGALIIRDPKHIIRK